MQSAKGKFPRTCRLLKPDEYRRVFNGCERSSDQNFVVLARINDLEQPRLGLAIAKKKIRRAVDRNKLKRLIRESFRTHQILLTGLDLIVLKRSEDMSESNAQYLNSLSLHWEKLAGKCKLS